MEGVDMSRRKRFTRAFAIAALGLGLAAPVAQARPIGVKGQSWTSAAAVTVAASHDASTKGSLPPNLRGLEMRNFQRAQPAAISVAAQSSTGGANWTAVGLATGLSLLVIGAFGFAAYRTRRPAPAA
jgi:hypothetical protein